MSFVHAYLACACALGLFLGLSCDIEDGDYRRAIAMIVVAALWPASLAVGIGGSVRDLIKAVVRLIAKARGESA